jgi:hypothetical protein
LPDDEPQSPLEDACEKIGVPAPHSPLENPSMTDLAGLAMLIPIVQSIHVDVTPTERSEDDGDGGKVRIVGHADAPAQLASNDRAIAIEGCQQLFDIFDSYSQWNISAEDRELIELLFDYNRDALTGSEDAARKAEAICEELNGRLHAKLNSLHAELAATIADAGKGSVEKTHAVAAAAKKVLPLLLILALLNIGDGAALRASEYNGGMATAPVDPATNAKARAKGSQSRSNYMAYKANIELLDGFLKRAGGGKKTNAKRWDASGSDAPTKPRRSGRPKARKANRNRSRGLQPGKSHGERQHRRILGASLDL